MISHSNDSLICFGPGTANLAEGVTSSMTTELNLFKPSMLLDNKYSSGT